MRSPSLALLLLAAGCARVVAPGGGPEDRDPPVLLESNPAPGVVEGLPERISLLFSERLDPGNSEPLVFPDPGHETRFRGNRIEIVLDSASRGPTLILLMPPGMADLRGNSSPAPVQLAWTTADTASAPSLSFRTATRGGGMVSTSSLVRLYMLPDTAAPIRTAFPDTSGLGTFPWLEPGDYRVTAFEDRDGSLTWENQTEPGTTSEVSLAAGARESLDLVFTVVDTVGPRILEAGALDGYHVLLQWNEELPRVPPPPDRFRLAAPDGSDLEILGTSLMPGRTSGMLLLHTRLLPDTLLTVFAGGVADVPGNLSLPDSLSFWADDSLPEEAFDVVSVYPADGQTEVNPAGPFILVLNAWVSLDSLAGRYTVTRVSDGASVEGTMERSDAVSFAFTPDMHLAGQVQHRIDLLPGLTTLWGDTLEARTWVFSTAWSTLPGSVSGAVSGTWGQVILVLAPAGGAGEKITAETSPGEYTIGEVPPGRYTLSAFRDSNENGIWDPGEPYGAWPGVLEVSPGQETGEVDVGILP
jgi:hypothetical protein